MTDWLWVSAQQVRADWFLLLAFALVGLCVGSFANVVIYRLPVIILRNYRAQAREFLEIRIPEHSEPPLSLSLPRSRCPQCGHQLRWYENIPVLSWLYLRGKCSNCKTAISARYPAIELIMGLLWVAVGATYGISAQSLGYLFLASLLVVAFWIDLDTQFLFDELTGPLIWGGLLFQLLTHTLPLPQAVAGGILGYVAFWSVFHGYKLLTGKEGMGEGDWRLFSALGIWFGPYALPAMLLISSAGGALYGGYMISRGKLTSEQPFAFGPFLALVGIFGIFSSPAGWFSAFMP
jgi:leader peptidase (prepilin peptidase) / N-methyltransferase